MSATRRPRASMSGSVVWASACPNSNTVACRAASMSARMATRSSAGCGSWGHARQWPASGVLCSGPPAGLGESAYRERILAGGHLDLDSDHAGGRAVLPDAVRGGTVFGVVRHTDHVSGNTGDRQCFRKRDISSPGKRLSAVVDGLSDMQKMQNETASLFPSRQLICCDCRAFLMVAAHPNPDRSASAASPMRHGLPTGDPDTHPLLQPLAEAQDAVARLEASAAAASPAVAAGLCARVAYREAAGWLAHTHTWVHARDLALRDAGVTGSYAGRRDGRPPRCRTANHDRAGHQTRHAYRPIRWPAVHSAWRGSGAGSPSTAPGGRSPMPRPCGKPSPRWAGPSRSTTRRSRSGCTWPAGTIGGRR